MAREYGEIVLKAMPDGSLLRLKDVATIEFDSEDYNMISMTDGRPSASIMIKQRPGSNASEVIKNIKTRMEEIKESSFAPGMEYHRVSAEDTCRGIPPCVRGGIYLPSGLPLYAYSCHRRSGVARRNIFLHAGFGLLYKHAYSVCPCACHRYCGGQCHCRG